MVKGPVLQLLRCEMVSLARCYAVWKFLPMSQALCLLLDSEALQAEDTNPDLGQVSVAARTNCCHFLDR